MMTYSNLKLVLMYLLALSVYFAVIEEYDGIFQLEVGSDVPFSVKRVFCFIFKFRWQTVYFKLKLYKNMMKYSNLKLVLMYLLALSVYFAYFKLKLYKN